MNVVFIGSTQFGYKCLDTLVSVDKSINVVGVLTVKEYFKISYSKESVHNVMYADFSGYCKANHIPCYIMKENMHEAGLIEHLRAWKPDIILVVGWYHLIPEEIRTMPPLGTVGFHASLLPKYRGGAPLVWAMIQGEREVGLSLFFLEEEVDTGALIAQIKIPVFMKDTIATVYEKVEKAGLEILRTSFTDYLHGRLHPVSQIVTNNGFNKWPARLPRDGRFSWKTMSPIGIYNFIRAQTKPYPGAFCYCGEDKITIWKASLYSWKYEGYQAGEVIRVLPEGEHKGILVATPNEDIPVLLESVSIQDRDVSVKEMLSYFENNEKHRFN